MHDRVTPVDALGSVARRGRPVPCVTIPSDDRAFAEHVRRLTERFPDGGPAALEARIVRLFPRAIVRARELSSEPEVWYVYRDGTWRAPTAPWWGGTHVPHLVFDRNGWIADANPAARGLLSMDDEPRHYSDFVIRGAGEAATMLFDIVAEGHPLAATLLLRPIGGDPIACEVRAQRVPGGLEAWLRLAEDVELRAQPEPIVLPELVTEPAEDAVFAAFAARQLNTMADPSPDGLGVRLRPMFPHARVTRDQTGAWLARRDGHLRDRDGTDWWLDTTLPRVRYDERGLILEANGAATDLLGEGLVGHHWHELVVPGSQDQVQPILDILRTTGEAVSRFRLPASDGRLVEFDSHTRLEGEDLLTTMRPSDR